MAVSFSACGQDPLVEIEAQVAKEKNPNRRELFSEFAQIFRRERARQPFDATRGLALAVAFDYPEFVEFFIKHGGNVNGGCLGGSTMLGYASEGHFLEVCQLLVKHGADVNSRSGEGTTPMMLAIKNTNYATTSSARRLSGVAEDDSERTRREVVEFLFEKGADVNMKANDGATSLLLAVVKKDEDMSAWLISKGADARAVWDNKVSPVHLAVSDETKSLVVLEMLLENGANPNAGAERGFENSALKMALDTSGGKDFSYAECLLKHGADVNTPTLLNFYVETQNLPVVKFLLTQGANPNSETEAKYNDNGGRNTSLFHAARSGNLELVKLLVEAGADVNKLSLVAEKSAEDRLLVPVMRICLDYPEIIKYLLKSGANPNAIVIREQTLLAHAVVDKKDEAVKLLLEAGANPNVQVEPDGEPGETVSVLEFASNTGNKALVLLLLEKGAAPPKGIEVVQIPNRNYAFGKYEVTQAQYKSVMGENPANFKGDNLPVENVSWNDAVRFCKKLTERERWLGRISQKQEYRLPSSEEWEHACRAGTMTRYYTGDSESDLKRAGWYRENSGYKTQPVGLKEANAFGLYDMHGNVWEWTSTPRGSGRVVRGGGWGYYAEECASSRWRSPEYGYSELGFRVVLAEAEEE